MNSMTDLQSLGRLIRQAGGKPNHRYYKAMRALRQLDILNRKPIKGEWYIVCQPNGKEVKVFVPEGGNIYTEAKDHNIEIFSFVKQTD
jgi:hypothetical protein